MRLVLLLLLAGCAGSRGFRPLSAECRAQIDACLAQCPPASANPPPPSGFSNDTRSDCQRRCEERCTK